MGSVRPPKSFNTVKHSNREARIKKQQKQRLLILAMLAVVALLLVSLTVFGIGSLISAISSSAGNEPANADTPPAQTGGITYKETTEIATKKHMGPLIVVNQNYAYSFPSSPTQGFINLKTVDRATINGNNVYQLYSKAGVLQMQSAAFTAFESMMRSYYMQTEDGSVAVREAYRSADTQESIGSSVKAGYSDHHTGYLLHICSYNGDSLPANHWIYQNCHKYGFIIRYPEGKEAQTGVNNYAEAIRYVGVAHATYMKNNGLCFEEYINVLKSRTLEQPLNVTTDDGSNYSIYYVPAGASDTVVQFAVPSNYSYEISGDNVGGFIVTVNLSNPTA